MSYFPWYRPSKIIKIPILSKFWNLFSPLCLIHRLWWYQWFNLGCRKMSLQFFTPVAPYFACVGLHPHFLCPLCKSTPIKRPWFYRPKKHLKKLLWFLYQFTKHTKITENQMYIFFPRKYKTDTYKQKNFELTPLSPEKMMPFSNSMTSSTPIFNIKW